MNESKKKFKVQTKLNFKVSVTSDYWDYITTVKHPHMKGKEKEVVDALKEPEQVRRSRRDKNVYLFYRRIIYDDRLKYICVVANKGEGFVITAYITDKIKEGERIWKK